MSRILTRLVSLVLVLVLCLTGVFATDWWDPLAVERQIYTYLTEELKFNSAAACGVLANIEYESNFQVTIVGDLGTSYGLCQWHNERYTALRTVCAARGLDYRTVEGQMEYLAYELKSSYSSLMGALKNVENSADGAYQAAYLWCIQFERPADMEEKAATRGNSAKYKYWNRYNSLSMIPLETEPLEPEEVIQQIEEQPVYIPSYQAQPESENTETGRRYVAEPLKKIFYVNRNTPATDPHSNRYTGFAVGVLFVMAGDGVKRGWALPLPEESEEEMEPDPAE